MSEQQRPDGRGITSLGGTGWRFGAVTARPLSAPADDRTEVGEWLPATVPGNVRSDLLAVGRIQDPFYGFNNEESQWVDDLDWWYTRPLQVNLDPGERGFLRFEGIDYISSVCLNDSALGQHEGMFSRQVYEITGPARSGVSEVAVRIWGSNSLPRRQLSWWERLWSPIATAFQGGSEAFPHRSATLKCQMGFGWDFAPRIRTVGIWDDVTLIVTGRVFIRDLFATAEPDGERALVSIEATIDSDRRYATRAETVITSSGAVDSTPQTWEFDLALEEGVQRARLELTLPDALLWQPWDRGEPNLYDLELRITRGGQVLDTAAARFGVRSVRLSERTSTPRGDSGWPLLVNGAPEFLRGANWVPLDALPGRLRRRDYERAIVRAREANINLLRVWGGGLRDKKAFYDLCDEQGIMVWQEFPLACLLLGHFPRSASFRNLVQREGAAIVRQLRNHPSLVLWCGGNEFSYRRNRGIVDALETIAKAEDGTRPFRRTSPGAGDAHNWLVWHGKAPLREYKKENATLVSEFGLQSLPSTASLSRFLPLGELFPPQRAWRYHHAQLQKLHRYLDALCPRTLEDWVENSQRVQALGLQVAIEHCRRRKYRNSGCLVWQLNDSWPAISWSLIDYFGEPKVAWKKLQSLYDPVLISLDYPLEKYEADTTLQARVWAVNDLLTPWHDCDVEVYLDGSKVFSRAVSLPPDSSLEVGSLRVRLDEQPRQLSAVLRRHDQVISANQYDLTYYDPRGTPILSRICHKLGQWLLA